MVENFCYDELWDLNQTWNADVPDFSTCFQDTVLLFIPCVVFSFAAIIELCFLPRYVAANSLPWSWRVILKLILVVLLFIISVIWCAIDINKEVTDGNIPISTIVASFARSFTYVIVITLMFKHRSHGVTTSSVLSLFWMCFAFTGAIMHRSVILKYNSQGTHPDLNYIITMLYYPLIYIELIMSFFVDVKSFNRLEVGNPLDEEAFISGITYIWFNRIVYKGLKRLLTVTDFLPLAVKLKASYAYEVFSKNWKFHLSSTEFEKQNLPWALLKSFWPWFLLGFILDMVYVLSLLVPPLILDGILEFVHDDYYKWKSYFYCAAIFIASFVGKTLLNNYIMYLLCTASQIKSSLISAVFRKNLMLANSARKDFTSGSITNLISVDVYRISQFALYVTSLISAPFRIILFIVLMWQYLGVSCLAGVGVIVLLIPISFVMSRGCETYMVKQMAIKDLRLKCMNEIIQGIKILKFYAWEVPFSLKISKTRKEEIKVIRLSQYCYVGISFIFSCAPILVSIASFATFLYVNKKNILDPTIAFVSLNLLDQLRFALFSLPDAISEVIQTSISLRRIKEFLTAEETDLHLVGGNPNEGKAITFKQASFSWSKDKETSFSLEDINFSFPEGSLIAVIGPVGCGKTSLLSALLGDMYKFSGSVDIKGNLAYVPQEAWILNRTLKNNILLEKPMHENIYSKILDCCCLRPDLEILPGKDETEIGEKGINLSGGQKQRVSVARAVFQNKDIYLLDDPLSAVDAHVRKALFEDVIGNQGLLKNKTRILVTHDISVLANVDSIIRMEEGKIVESGTYKELMDGSTTFLNFIKTHTGKVEKDESDKSLSAAAGDADGKDAYKRTISEDWVKPSESKQSGAELIEDEKMEEGGVKRGIYFNYIRHMGWPILALSLLGYVAFVSFEAASNIWVADWTADSIVNGTEGGSNTVWRLSVYSGFGFAQALTIVLGVGCIVYGSTKASQRYHSEMLESILKSPMSFFDVTPMGRIINRFSTDMDTLDIHIIYDIDGWISCFLHTLATFVVIGMNTPLFLACIIPLVLLYYMFLKLHLNTSRQIMRLQSTTRSPIYSHLLESIYGVSSIKAFHVESEFIEKLEEHVDNHMACSFNSVVCNRWVHFWLDLIGSAVVLIATWLCIADRSSLGASFVGLIITYALSVTDSLMWLVRTNTELENKSVAIERVDEYCQLQSEAPWQKPENDPEITWPESGEIVFDNYSTRYRENLDLVLKDVNLSVHSNEKVGIVGRTGAGKSSVTFSLFRIIEPAQGTILIDNVDIAKIGLHALRSKLTIIPQDPVLFTGSLRFNLDPNDEYEDIDIWKSLENSHLKEFVSSLSEGLQHGVEEGGGNLSAGQKQLLCLSRALLKKSKILILDEATAAVDMDTDSLVQDTIKTAFADHTVITIAHRLNTVMDYDKIVVMDAGQVVEVGNPLELLKNKNTHFYEMSKKAGLA